MVEGRPPSVAPTANTKQGSQPIRGTSERCIYPIDRKASLSVESVSEIFRNAGLGLRISRIAVYRVGNSPSPRFLPSVRIGTQPRHL